MTSSLNSERSNIIFIFPLLKLKMSSLNIICLLVTLGWSAPILKVKQSNTLISLLVYHRVSNWQNGHPSLDLKCILRYVTVIIWTSITLKAPPCNLLHVQTMQVNRTCYWSSVSTNQWHAVIEPVRILINLSFIDPDWCKLHIVPWSRRNSCTY